MWNSYCMFAGSALKCSPPHGGLAMAHWATSPLDRNQVVLFSPTLDQSIPAEHPVRLFSETLDALDFSKWESTYVRVVGQPPIHPRVLAGCILYRLSLGIEASD